MSKAKSRHLFTSESVTEGHPDKICDQISDGILDAIFERDPNGRVACEAMVTTGLAIVAGEITTSCYVEIPKIVRDTIREIGYTDPHYGFDYLTCGVMTSIQEQSSNIAQGVDTGGAGDQGMMFGYATDETPEYMPMPIVLAHKLTRRLAEVRKKKLVDYLRPDGKSQVTIEYDDGKPKRIEAIVLSAHHDPKVTLEKIKHDLKKLVIDNALPKKLMRNDTKIYINPTGKFAVGGPQADTGVTGRKIIVDTYGGVGSHGGGCFCLDGHSLVNTEKGLLKIKDMKRDVEDGLVVKTDIHPRKAKEWYDNGEKETIKITTSEGYYVEGTKNQSIRVIDKDGNYIWRRLDGLKKGDYVAIHCKNRLFGEEVNLSDFEYKYKEGTAEGRKNKFIFPKNLTADYAYLLGLLVGDGNCMMEGGISICVCSGEQKKNVQNLFKKLFGSKGKIFGHWAFMGGVELRAYLKYLGLGYKRAWDKEVPHTIFKAPKTIVASFLRGLFDTDGGVHIQGRYKTSPDIKLNSTSLTLIHGVQQLLLNFGIISRIQPINNIGREFSIDGRKAVSRRIVYQLRIKGGESIKIFEAEIGFGLSEKQRILKKIDVESKKDYFVVPNQRDKVSRLFKKLSANERYKDRCKIGRFTRMCRGKATKELTYNKLSDFLTSYSKELRRDKDYEHLKSLYEMKHYYDRVKQIETSFNYVYDLLVPVSHTFTANGFVCHNSGKDPTKVDRSASYMARYIAKNIVAAKLAKKCEIQLAYAIGVAEPVSVMVNTLGTGKLPDEELVKLVIETFDMRPKAIIEHLKLRRPIYKKTACYGHFGRMEAGFTWEQLDMAEELKKKARRM